MPLLDQLDAQASVEFASLLKEMSVAADGALNACSVSQFWFAILPVVFTPQLQTEELERKMEVAMCGIKALRNAQQAINALPSEVLAQVLVFLDSLQTMENVEDLHAASAQKTRSLLIITRVCRHWRSLAFSTPNLWNHIHIHHILLPLASRSFTLSGNLPLTVYFSNDINATRMRTAGEEGTMAALQAISKHSIRLEKLFLCADWAPDSPYWRELQEEAPMLRVLQLAGDRPPTIRTGIELPSIFGGSLASVEEASISWYTPPAGGFVRESEGADPPPPKPG